MILVASLNNEKKKEMPMEAQWANRLKKEGILAELRRLKENPNPNEIGFTFSALPVLIFGRALHIAKEKRDARRLKRQ